MKRLFTYRLLELVLCIAVLGFLFLASHVYGYTDTSWQMVWGTYFHYDGSNEQLIIRDLRLPRAIAATLIGAALAVSGVVMQSLTKNPLASPDILGISAGASFFVVAGISLFAVSTQSEIIICAFFGALLAAILVFLVGSLGREGMTPLTLTLAGVTLTALFSSFTSALLVLDERALESVLFWLAGGIEGKKLSEISTFFPLFIVGFIVIGFLMKPIYVLSVSEDVAKGLGQKTGMIRMIALGTVVLLAGSAVGIGGPIGFIGLVIPHIVRKRIGNDYIWTLPYAAVYGAILLLLADIGARFILFPKEVPVGVLTAIIGAPFFIYIARKGKLSV